jgi:hypothetical protein
MKALSEDYTKWSSKLNELEHLMKNMLIKLNEKRLDAENSPEPNSSLVILIMREICLSKIDQFDFDL